MIVPCKDCKDRYVGCHGKCEKYKEFREILDEQRHERIKNIIVNTPHYNKVAELTIKKANRRR